VSRRTERVAEELRAELARLLREEAADPRLRLLTITRVEVTADLSSARVGWSRLEAGAAGEGAAAAAREVAAGLARAAPFLRRRLAHELPWRRVPELHFRHDPSLALGAATLTLLREIEDGEGR
jgi:ribosome-binding factor A